MNTNVIFYLFVTEEDIKYLYYRTDIVIADSYYTEKSIGLVC